MFRKISIFLIFFLCSCVENLIHISIFDNGSYIVNYTSIGDKDDLLEVLEKTRDNLREGGNGEL